MRVSVTQKGTGFDTVIGGMVRSLNQANRKTGREISRVAVKAFKSSAGVSHFAGYPLKFKAKKITTTFDSAHIHFQASPVGFWCMVESGTRPHEIRPRNGKALRAGSETFWAHVNHPGTGGTGAYSRGEAAAIEAIDKIVEEVYAESIEAAA